MAQIPTLSVVAGEPFAYRIEVRASDPNAVGIRLLNKPSGAVIDTEADGTPVLQWTPPLSVQLQTMIIIQAYDKDNQSHVSTQRVVLEKGTVATPFVARETQIQAALDPSPTDQPTLAQPTPKLVTPEQATPEQVTLAQAKEALEVAVLNLDPDATDTPVAVSKTELPETGEQNEIASVKSLYAPELPELKTQMLEVGSPFQLFIRPTDADGDAVALTAKRLPEGAQIDEVFAGSWLLNWRPDASQAGLHSIALSVAEKTSEALRSQRILELNVRDPNAQAGVVLAAANDDSSEIIIEVPAGADTEEATAKIVVPKKYKPNSTVYFEPLSSQIVSAGQTVKFKVVTGSKDESETLVHIDRLPGRASFDAVTNGTRNFHWPTTEADQGEHTFRFTAINPADTSQMAVKNIVIIVGDPAGPGSSPQ